MKDQCKSLTPTKFQVQLKTIMISGQLRQAASHKIATLALCSLAEQMWAVF